MDGVSIPAPERDAGTGYCAAAGGDFDFCGYAAAAGRNGHQRNAVFKNLSNRVCGADASGNGTFQRAFVLQPAFDQRAVYDCGAALLYAAGAKEHACAEGMKRWNETIM